MTVIEIARDDGGSLIRARGHQDQDIWCAGVSAIMCALIAGARLEGQGVKWEMGDGDAACQGPRTERIDAMFDMAERAFREMAAAWPDRIRVEG